MYNCNVYDVHTPQELRIISLAQERGVKEAPTFKSMEITLSKDSDWVVARLSGKGGLNPVEEEE